MVLLLVDLGDIYRVILYKILSNYYFIVFPYISFYKPNYCFKFFFNLSFFNYLAFNIPALGLYINFYSKILRFFCYSLLGNFKYLFLPCYLAIFLLNTI